MTYIEERETYAGIEKRDIEEERKYFDILAKEIEFKVTELAFLESSLCTRQERLFEKERNLHDFVTTTEGMKENNNG